MSEYRSFGTEDMLAISDVWDLLPPFPPPPPDGGFGARLIPKNPSGVSPEAKNIEATPSRIHYRDSLLGKSALILDQIKQLTSA